jgi:hypothetical protein
MYIVLGKQGVRMPVMRKRAAQAVRKSAGSSKDKKCKTHVPAVAPGSGLSTDFSGIAKAIRALWANTKNSLAPNGR